MNKEITYENDFGEYNNPRYDKLWKKLSRINHDCCQTRRDHYINEENWEKEWDGLTEFEKDLYYSGYLHYADEINGYFFNGVWE